MRIYAPASHDRGAPKAGRDVVTATLDVAALPTRGAARLAPALPAVRPSGHPTARELAHAKVMAVRFVAHFGALRAEDRGRIGARLGDVATRGLIDAARAHVRAAAVDPDVVGPDLARGRFVGALDCLARDAAAGDDVLAARAADVVRALLVHAHPAYRPAFDALYAPFDPHIGFDRLLLG